jgi:hypothetical protein
MAFCSRCGQQTDDDAEFCTACSAYAADVLSVGAYSGVVSSASHFSGSTYGALPPDRYSLSDTGPYPAPGPDRRFQYEYEQTLSPGLDRHMASPPSGRWISLAAAMAVLVITATVAVVLVGQHRHAGHAPPADRPSATARSSSAAPTSAPAATAAGQLSVDSAVAAAPHKVAIIAFLNRYFSAINHHDYSAYERLFSPALRRKLSAATFSAGFGTTTDSAENLRSIGVLGAGQVDALVTFTSHQVAADSPTNSRCTAWSIALYLIRQGRRYLLVAPPAGYTPSYHTCH